MMMIALILIILVIVVLAIIVLLLGIYVLTEQIKGIKRQNALINALKINSLYEGHVGIKEGMSLNEVHEIMLINPVSSSDDTLIYSVTIPMHHLGFYIKTTIVKFTANRVSEITSTKNSVEKVME